MLDKDTLDVLTVLSRLMDDKDCHCYELGEAQRPCYVCQAWILHARQEGNMMSHCMRTPHWKVYRNGIDTGIRETHYLFATRYWTVRAIATGSIYFLRLVQEG